MSQPHRNFGCNTCNQPGHFSKECPIKSSEGTLSSPDPMACHVCGAHDHVARRCPAAVPSDATCFHCNGKGHFAETCPDKDKPKVARPFDGKCYTCGKVGHFTRECPDRQKRREVCCYNCGKTGHMARSCPTKGGIGPTEPEHDSLPEDTLAKLRTMVEAELYPDSVESALQTLSAKGQAEMKRLTENSGQLSEELKQIEGEKLYVVMSTKDSALTGKMTGMLLESMSLRDVGELIVDNTKLEEKIKECREVLAQHTASVESTEDVFDGF
ncbi:DNA-binding protein HEXBP [Pelomyxa schiedti]|nr:DNA-binding protein HEXBP [Pelomyxa schiedti]